MSSASVRLWGREIGAVSWVGERDLGVFQYAPEFVPSGIEVAPLTMPLREEPYEFPGLPRQTFRGLPGLVADSLPDAFGNTLIDAWLAAQGRTPESFDPVERLCYVGTRGMGALEYEPALLETPTRQRRLEIEALVELANRVLDERASLAGRLSGIDDKEVLEDILRVGTSAGGARAKAILSWNEASGEFRSGQIPAEEGFEYWLLKFDGVAQDTQREVGEPLGYGRIEYAYALMARSAGIEMSECRLHHEGGRAHFMTKRFDRGPQGQKLHMLSLGAIRHFDFNQPAYAYEQAIETARLLSLPAAAIEQLVTRAFFNVMARNHDDHVKNIAFLMDRAGCWSLAPAFDIAYAFNPAGTWTSRHQMSLNGKRDDFARADLLALGRFADIKTARCKSLIEKVAGALREWLSFAERAGVDAEKAARIGSAHRSP